MAGKFSRLRNLFGKASSPGTPEAKGSDAPLNGTSLQTSRNFMRSAMKLSKYWGTKKGLVGWGLLAACIGLSLANTVVSVEFAHLNQSVIDGIMKSHDLAVAGGHAAEHAAAFYHTMIDMAKWFGAAGLLIADFVYSGNVQSLLSAHWRKAMTKDFMDRYLEKNAFHRLQHIHGNTDNPEQRIQEDIENFTTTAVSVPLGILSSLMTVSAFAGVLYNMSSHIPMPYLGSHPAGWLLYAALGYTAAVTGWTYGVTKPLVGLSRRYQKLSADFRNALGDIRKNSEPIVFMDGVKSERRALDKKFDDVMDNTYRLIKRNKAISWVQSYYNNGSDFVPFILLAPTVMMGGMSYGQMIQGRIAMGQITSGISWPLNNMDFFARLKATMDRLATLDENIEIANRDMALADPDFVAQAALPETRQPRKLPEPA